MSQKDSESNLNISEISNIDLEIKEEIKTDAINFFLPDYLRELNPKALIMIKDQYSLYSLILRKSLSVVNSVNFELVNEIRNIPENLPLDDPEKIVLFQQMRINYMILFSDKVFAIFNLNLKDYNNYVIFQIQELEENERIISIKPLNNDLKLPYFILVTSLQNVHIMSLINLNPQSNFLNDTYFETSRLNENEGLFKKLTSYLLQNKNVFVESDQMFVLNPSSNGILYKNNTKMENSIFLFNQNCLKIIEFSFIGNRLRGEIAFQINIANIIKDRIKSYNERFAKTNITQYSIEDADAVYDKNSNSFFIYAIAKQNEYYYVLRIRIESNYSISTEILEDLNKLKKEDLQNLFNKVKIAKLFLNKNLNEFYAVLSTDDKSYLFFFSSKISGKGIAYKKASLAIDGVSTNFLGSKSYLNVLFQGGIVIELLFDVRDNRLIYKDISKEFYKGVMMKSSFIKPSQNKNNMNLDYTMNDVLSEKSEILFIERERNPFNLLNAPNKVNTLPYKSNIMQDYMQNSKNLQFSEENVILVLTEKLRKYFEFKTSNRECDLNAIYDINIDIEDLTSFLNSVCKSVETNVLREAVEKIILNIIDNKSLNINNINMDTKKSEYIIIEYLKERADKYQIFLEFLKDYKVFENFDANRNLYNMCLKYFEILNAAIKLREHENFLLKNNMGGVSLMNISNPEQKLINISHKFFDDCFVKWKEIKGAHLNKYSVYLSISAFDEYLKFILERTNAAINDVKETKENNLYLAYSLIGLWNSVFSEIKRTSYFHELANNQLEIPGLNELNTDYKYTIADAYYQKQENIQCSLWLFEVKGNFLEKLEAIFKFLVQDDKKEFASARNSLSNFSKSVIDFADNLLFFYRIHYNYKSPNSPPPNEKNKSVEFEEKKREIIRSIINFDYEKSLKIAIKYQSLFSIAFICNLFKCPEKLKEYFNTLHQSITGGMQIEYMLKVYLILDMQKKIDFEKVKQIENSTIKNYDDVPLYFDFFDSFGDYHAQMANVVVSYPKLSFYYEFFLKSREGVFDRHLTVIDRSSWQEFLEIEKLINVVNKRSCLENVLKMVRYVLKMNLIACEEEASNKIFNAENQIAIENQNEKELSDKISIDIKNVETKTKIIKLDYLRQQTNFYQMLYEYDKSFGYFTDGSQKFLAGADNVYENFKALCATIKDEVSAKLRNNDYDSEKHIAEYSNRIKMLLNLIRIFKEIYGIDDSNQYTSELITTLVDILIEIDLTRYINENIQLDKVADERISKLKSLSIFKKLKDQNAFMPNVLDYLGLPGQLGNFKKKLFDDFPKLQEEKMKDFLQFLNLL